MNAISLILCGVLLLADVIVGSATQCIHCIAQGEEQVCDSTGESALCNGELAERYLSIFTRFNEDIDVETADKTQFKCFKFKMRGQEDYHMKGCVYKNLKICDKMLEGMYCETCESTDCNGLRSSDYHDDDDSGNVTAPAISIVLGSVCAVLVGVFYFKEL